MKNPHEWAGAIGDIVRDYVQRQMAPILARVAALEARPAPIDGQPGKDGAPGLAGRDGLPGRDGAAGRDGAVGSDGADGRDGKDGAAGLNGKDGLDGLGFDDLALSYDGRRTLTLRFARGERVKEFPITVPWPLDCGVWKDGEVYARGDGVSYDGSWWMAQQDTDSKPGTGNGAWRLAVKRGRDGRDGVKGDKGDTGSAGRHGRDLTNLGADGSKWA